MKIIKNKLGIAMENAILFMLVIFIFCSLLISLSLYGHYQTKLEKMMITNRIQLDQIGEKYLDYLKDGTTFDTDNENYKIYIDNNILNVKNKEDKIVLYVQAIKDDDNNIIVKKWCYGQPVQD